MHGYAGRKMRVGATAAIDDVRLQVEEITPDGKRIVIFDKDIDVLRWWFHAVTAVCESA